MKSKKTAQPTRAGRREAYNLAGRYGEIGIPAVAAALRYQRDAKIPPVPAAEGSGGQQPDQRLEESVAEFA